MSDNRSTIAFPATNPLPPGRRGVSVRCSYPLSLPGFRFNAEAGEMVAFIAPELAMLDAVGNALFHASQFDQRAPETIDIERMLEVWGSERPVVVFRNEIRHNVANPVEAESLAYAKAMAVPQISADAEDLVCRLTGVPATSLREMYGASESSPDAWRVSLARLLLMSKPARHGVLIVEESPHTRDIIDVLLAARPWIQPTVIVLSADAAACIKANRRLYVSLVKELDEYQVVRLNGAITSMLANIPRDGFFSSTRCPCGDSLEANEAKLRRCARCNSDALGGWECTACPYGVCIRCLDSERFVEARVAEGRDDSYTLAMSAPAAVQLVVPDVVGLVLRFACSTVAEAHSAGSVCRSWRKGLLADEELWAVFFARRWPDRRMPRRATSTLYRARVLSELRAVGCDSVEDYRVARGAAAVQTSTAFADTVFTPIEECEFAFKCPLMFSALRPLQRELGISGAPAEVRFCDVCTKKVYEVRSQAELEHHRSLRHCVSFTRENMSALASVESLTRYFILGDAADGGRAAVQLLRQIAHWLPLIYQTVGKPDDEFAVRWVDGAVEVLLQHEYEQACATIQVMLDAPANLRRLASRAHVWLSHTTPAAEHARSIHDALLTATQRDEWMGDMDFSDDPPTLDIIPL
jgi:hypothetical protein